MAFTKINAAGIGTTETVTVDGLTVINNGSFGGNLTVSGVLTYEDVTNVDSVGLITARNGIVVGSGITLSKDGDIFATGITTVSGNVKVGTGITLSPDGDGFYTGVVTATTFKGDGSQLTGVNSDVVDDTSPQLGGNLDVNTKNIVFGDSSGSSDDRLTFGAGTDLSIYHNGSDSYIEDSGTGVLVIKSNTLSIRNAADDEQLAKFIENSGVDLYYDNGKKFFTITNGVQATNRIIVGESTNQRGLLSGDQNGVSVGSISDLPFSIIRNSVAVARFDGANFNILNDSGKLQLGAAQDFQLYHDGTTNYIKSDNGGIAVRVASGNRLEINGTSGDVIMQGNSGKNFTWDNSNAYLNLNDNARLTLGTGNDMYIWHDGTDSRIRSETGNLLVAVNEFKVTRTQDDSTAFSVDQDGGITLAHNHGARLSTLSGGVVMGSNYSEGTTEPFFVETGGTVRRRYSTTAGSGLHFTGGAIFPTTGPGSYSNGGITWGTQSYRWGQIFSVWTNISTSDRNLKNTITTSDLGLDFVNQLKPVSFKFNRATSDRTHYGLISQDVEDLLPKIGKTAMDFGGFCKDKNERIVTNADGTDSVIEEEGETYSLRYDEFIAPLIKAVQELSAKNDALEARIKTLEG